MNQKKSGKYLFLLDVLRKHCKGAHCEDKFKKLISLLDEDSLKFLSECVRNSLDPNRIKLLPKHKQKKIIKKLKPHKVAVRKSIKPNLSHKSRKKILQQQGGWFLPLISAVAPLISSLFTGGK